MSSKPLAFIVEDDPFQNQIFSTALQNDFEVNPIYDGQEAMQQLEQIVPQLIVLDMNLPGVFGEEILKFVRSNPEFSRVRIILATADAKIAELVEQDVNIVLLKPVSPSQLVALARRLIFSPYRDV